MGPSSAVEYTTVRSMKSAVGSTALGHSGTEMDSPTAAAVVVGSGVEVVLVDDEDVVLEEVAPSAQPVAHVTGQRASTSAPPAEE